MRAQFEIIVLGCALFCAGLAAAGQQPVLTVEQILAGNRLDLLHDEVYYHPVVPDPVTGEVYVGLRKWDLIFDGPLPGHEDPVNNLIPGRYDHVIAYVGKDVAGFAYFVELNVISQLNNFDTPENLEGIRWFSPGTDFGDVRHPSGARFWREQETRYSWARNFNPATRARLREHDAALTARVSADLEQGLPYQLPVDVSRLAERKVMLVDDGFEGGATCSDYWTTLFEEYAGVCFYGVRFSAAQFIDYARYDPAGQAAYIPTEFNPLPLRLNAASLLALGFTIVEDEPHQFRCGGDAEAGLVLAELIMDNELLLEPEYVEAPADVRYLSRAHEFYHPVLERYVIGNAVEAALIDAGQAGSGWARTGQSFKTWSRPRAGALAVSRFYLPHAGAHFMTLDSAERDHLLDLQTVADKARQWQLEGIGFYLPAPINGGCPSGTLPLWRYYRETRTGEPAHRYLSAAWSDLPPMAGWNYEGVAACTLQ